MQPFVALACLVSLSETAKIVLSLLPAVAVALFPSYNYSKGPS